MLAFILSAMLLLAPGRDHTVLGKAIADVIEEKGCLYTGKDCERRSAAVMAVWAWYESGLHIDAKGKQGDCGAFQHVTLDRAECELLRSDAAYAASVAHSDMRASLKACGDLSAYARGTCAAGRGFVKRRMPKVLWVLARVHP